MLPIFHPMAMAVWKRASQLNSQALFFENPLGFCVGGFVLWIFFALFFRMPSSIYVFAHEWTHALFVKLCGGQVKKISVKSDRGFVLSDRSNFLIALAPYLFPFYAVIWSLGYLGMSLLLPMHPYQVWFWTGFGMCLGYHWTMTGHMLTTHQTDFSSQGYFFSFVLI